MEEIEGLEYTYTHCFNYKVAYVLFGEAVG